MPAACMRAQSPPARLGTLGCSDCVVDILRVRLQRLCQQRTIARLCAQCGGTVLGLEPHVVDEEAELSLVAVQPGVRRLSRLWCTRVPHRLEQFRHRRCVPREAAHEASREGKPSRQCSPPCGSAHPHGVWRHCRSRGRGAGGGQRAPSSWVKSRSLW